MFHRFIVSAALLAVIFGGTYSYQKISAYKIQIKELQTFCNAFETTPHFVTVTRVIDGDTLVLTDNSRVRLLGPDTPETCHPDARGKLDSNCRDEFMGPEAAEFLRKNVEGQEIVILGDPNEGSRDVFGRLLRYVYVKDRFINLELVRLGYAPVYSGLAKKTKFYADFKTAEAEAKTKKLGVWSRESKI